MTLDVGHILSSVTSSLIRLSLATSAMAAAPATNQRPSVTIQASCRTMPLTMLCRLQRALHSAKLDYCWDLADAALSRAKSVAQCLRSNQECNNVVAALEGTFEPESLPANGHLEDQKPPGSQSSPTPIDHYAWNIDLNAFGLDWGGVDSGLTGVWGAHAGEEHVLPMYD
jgi:hypothetical protein